jgi:hypothetical protein
MLRRAFPKPRPGSTIWSQRQTGALGSFHPSGPLPADVVDEVAWEMPCWAAWTVVATGSAGWVRLSAITNGTYAWAAR